MTHFDVSFLLHAVELFLAKNDTEAGSITTSEKFGLFYERGNHGFDNVIVSSTTQTSTSTTQIADGNIAWLVFPALFVITVIRSKRKN